MHLIRPIRATFRGSGAALLVAVSRQFEQARRNGARIATMHMLTTRTAGEVSHAAHEHEALMKWVSLTVDRILSSTPNRDAVAEAIEASDEWSAGEREVALQALMRHGLVHE